MPHHLGRARTSTVVLALLFVALYTLYLFVRPDDPAAGRFLTPPATVQTPSAPAPAPAPAGPSSTAVPTTAPPVPTPPLPVPGEATGETLAETAAPTTPGGEPTASASIPTVTGAPGT